MVEVVRFASAGMTVPLGDPGRMADAMLHLAADANARSTDAANAERAFVDHFTLDSMMSVYTSCYEGAAGRPGK